MAGLIKDQKHSDPCREWMLKKHADRRAFMEAHPDCCRKCEGWGGFWTPFDPSPAGVSLSPGSITDHEACADCMDVCLCPWCGASVDDPESEDTYKCKQCGWKEGYDGMPPIIECGCYMDDDLDENEHLKGLAEADRDESRD